MPSRPCWDRGLWTFVSAAALLSACGDQPRPQPPEETYVAPPPTSGESASGPIASGGQPTDLAGGQGDGTGGSDAALPGLGAAGASMSPAALDPNAVTYQKDIRPIVEGHCLACHVAGGAGPFPLDTWQAVQESEAAISEAVIGGHMPPWPASDSCRPLRDAPAFDRMLFARWQSGGYLEGDAADYHAPIDAVAVDLGEPSVLLDAGQKYQPPDQADDYRCFVLDYSFAKDGYVTAMDIVPDQRAEVHHVQIHLVSATQLTQVQALDAQSPGSGYPCNAGTGTLSQNFFSWRPGGTRVVFDRGDAAFIEQGTSIVIQVHYNTQFLPEGSGPTGDQTKIALWTLPDGALPDRVIYRTGVTAPFSIPAGAPDVLATQTVSMGTLSAFGGLGGLGGTFVPGEIIGMTPHAHQFASKMHAKIEHAGGAEDCLVDIPEWSFHWQLDYLFTQGVPYQAGDTLTATCDFDNSLGHQPIVDGVRQTPHDVTWGEGSLDEMCLHYVWLRMDRAAFLAAR